MRKHTRMLALVVTLTSALLLVGGCVLAPRQAKREQARVDRAGDPYRRPFERRALQDLPTTPAWQDLLRRAFLANGELEVAYFEWAMAVSRIQQVGAYPNSPLSVGFEYMFSNERLKAWDRTTLTAGPDAMENLAFPSKVYQSAKVALRDAEAAGKRFAAAKFALQRRVLNAWYEYALLGEKIRIQRENVELLRLLNETAAGRVRAGAAQQDLLRTDIQYRLALNELNNLEAQLPQQRATLNALLAREPDASLEPPRAFPAIRELVADDAALLAIGVEANPELAALAREVAGREDALERARMEYIPDFNPFVGFTGGVSQVVGVGVSLPTVIPEIQGMIKESRANLRRVEAVARQTRFDRAAEYVATLVALRNAERQARLFRDDVLPAAQRVLDNARQTYATGAGVYLDLIDAQRTLLDVRVMIVEALAAREKFLADLETLAGVDFETVPSTTQTTTAPAMTGAEVSR